jgi:hypothetical protein
MAWLLWIQKSGGSQIEASQGKKQDPISTKKLNVVVQACHPSNNEKLKIGGWRFRLAWAKSQIPPPK